MTRGRCRTANLIRQQPQQPVPKIEQPERLGHEQHGRRVAVGTELLHECRPPTRGYRGSQGHHDVVAGPGALASNTRRASPPASRGYRSGDTCGFRAYVPARGGARVVATRCGGRISTRESRTRRLGSRARPFLSPLAVFHDSSKSSVASYSTAARFPSLIIFVAARSRAIWWLRQARYAVCRARSSGTPRITSAERSGATAQDHDGAAFEN